MLRRETRSRRFPVPWEQVQGAVWMLGIAVLAWQGWWWPGILVLVALSTLVEGFANVYERQEKERVIEETTIADKSAALPAECPNCGSPVDQSKLERDDDGSVRCRFCHTALAAAG